MILRQWCVRLELKSFRFMIYHTGQRFVLKKLIAKRREKTVSVVRTNITVKRVCKSTLCEEGVVVDGDLEQAGCDYCFATKFLSEEQELKK